MQKERAKGPASYFPSIEAKYGQPMSHWFSILQKLRDLGHMEMVAHLKSRYGMGHGHANAAVAAFRASHRI